MPADRVERYGRAMGRDLAALGITADLAPVLDVTGACWDGVIGDRSFGGDPATVARAAVASQRGLAAGGVAPVGKHFGHGATTVDSHQRLPVAASSARLHGHDLAPFRAAIRAGLDAVMVGHLVVRAVDPGHPVPGGGRRPLRGRMGFDGLVVSDALEMGALANSMSLPVAAERPWPPGSTSSSSPATPTSRPSSTTRGGGGRRPPLPGPGRPGLLRVQRFKRVERWAGC